MNKNNVRKELNEIKLTFLYLLAAFQVKYEISFYNHRENKIGSKCSYIKYDLSKKCDDLARYISDVSKNNNGVMN